MVRACVCVCVTRQQALVNKTLKLSLWNSIYFHFKSFDMWSCYSSLCLHFSFCSTDHWIFWNNCHRLIFVCLPSKPMIIVKKNINNNRQLLKEFEEDRFKRITMIFIYAQSYSLFHISRALLSFRNFHLFNYSSSYSRKAIIWFHLFRIIFYLFIQKWLGSAAIEKKDPWNGNDMNCQ